MKELKVKPIPTREWTYKQKSKKSLLSVRDRKRKESQESVNKRIYYMWFNYLKLCLNLEEIKYSVEKKGAKGIVVDKTIVKVNKKIYKDWDLNDLSNMNFKKWYKDPKHQKLFTEGRFKPQSGARYHSLVKRYNVFIEYYNGMNKEFRSRGDISQEMRVCSDIIEKYQKERFDQLKKNVESGKSMLNDLVKKDVKICGKEILSCCQGEFPKSS